MSAPPFFQSAGRVQRRSPLLGGKRRTNGSNMGEPIKTRKGKLAGRGKHDARLGRVVQIKKRCGGTTGSCGANKKKVCFSGEERMHIAG